MKFINNIKLITFLSLLLLGIQYGNGQEIANDTLHVEAFKEDSDEDCLSYYDEDLKNSIYTHPQIMAEYPGGERELLKYISGNIKAQVPNEDDMLQTKSSLVFIVDDDGIIKHIKVIKNRVKDEHSETKYEYKTEEEYTPYDKEFVRVLKTIQRWNPAVCNGRNVPSLISLPIRFHPSR